MHVRVSRVRRKGKVYEYVQLVESFRRPSDGMPAHRVVANLGRRSPGEVANLRAALQAGRNGEQVVVVSAADAASAPKPSANRRYLDVAVLVELWREFGLDELLGEALPIGEADIEPASVVAALAIQRCTDPGSKLFATRWFPRTALPELLAVSPKQFNNTRVHRVLDALDAATPELMRRLPQMFRRRDGAFAAMFLDVTDTWFVGHGPEVAERGKTKEGMLRRKIGIVLLCNEHGYPLRWEVVSGCCNDSQSMGSMVRALGGLSWASQVPLVMDRAMGNTAHLRELGKTGVHFVTALVSNEFDSYAPKLPHAQLADLMPDPKQRKQACNQAAKTIRRAGYDKVADDCFIADLGVVQYRDGSRSELEQTSEEPTRRAMRLCREITVGVANGQYASYRQAGKVRGLGHSVTNKYRSLHQLPEDLQQAVIHGAVAGRPLTALVAVARIPDEQQQRRAFEALRYAPPAKPTNSTKIPVVQNNDAAQVRVRVVANFNPERFVEQRLTAQRKLAKVDAFVTQLNAKLASSSRYNRDRVVTMVDHELRRHELLGIYKLVVTERQVDGYSRLQAKLEFDGAAWTRRRRNDGFAIIVAHPNVKLDAEALCRLYRAKDRVEKDFQTIKGLVQLRPVRHRCDAKVRAHIAVCMLALILERALDRKLQADTCTAERALELLATCHLNEYRAKRGDAAYTITSTDDEQTRILRQLRLQHLADDHRLMRRITPR